MKLALAGNASIIMSSAIHVRVGTLYRLGDPGHFLWAMHKNVARLKPKIVKLSNTVITTMTILFTALLVIISLIFVASIIIFPLHCPTRDMQEDYVCKAESHNLPKLINFCDFVLASYIHQKLFNLGHIPGYLRVLTMV